MSSLVHLSLLFACVQNCGVDDFDEIEACQRVQEAGDDDVGTPIRLVCAADRHPLELCHATEPDLVISTTMEAIGPLCAECESHTCGICYVDVLPCADTSDTSGDTGVPRVRVVCSGGGCY